MMIRSHTPSVFVFFMLLCALQFVAANQPPVGLLLYSGLTDNGWQIFAYDLLSGKETQLTHTPGDKHEPQLASNGRILFRNSQGLIYAIDDQSREEVPAFKGMDKIASFELSPNAQTVYFCRLVDAGIRRQYLFRQDVGATESSLVYAPYQGSVAEFSLSPSGRYIAATLIQRINEKRLILLSSDRSDEGSYVTSEWTITADPVWVPDESAVCFSQQNNAGNWDLFLYKLTEDSLQPLIQAETSSEINPHVSADGRYLFYEAYDEDIRRLAYLPLKPAAAVSMSIEIPRPARQPYWLDHLPWNKDEG